MGTTTQENLSAGWIPSTQLTQVFDGNVDYLSGQNTIMIPLQVPFTYTGGNLVMMVNRPMDTQYFSSMDTFASQTVGTNRSLKVQSDGTLFDPANPPAGAALSGQFPKTSIHIAPLGTDPIAMINPSAWNFGTVLMNTTHNRLFNVMNGGGGTMTVNTISIAGSPFFTLTNMPTLPATLGTGQSVAFTVNYAPTSAGVHNAIVTIVDNITRQTHTVEISANSLDPTIYTLPYMQNFDAVTAPALPVDWSTLVSTIGSGTIRTTTTNPVSAPNCVEMSNVNDASASMLLIAPPYTTTLAVNTSRLNFRGRSSGAGMLLEIGVMTDSQNAA
ncbi:MAG: choice-of-anchor D domain-containing protein, partial [Candidatus Cloacimonadaceae bacterium]|nr:choice-of-anchor D domain-containing protein [Candidatus Cloacimonadaceae bacterium]